MRLLEVVVSGYEPCCRGSSACSLPHNAQQRLDGGPICRAGADVVRAHDPLRVDQHITSQLIRVARGPARPAPAEGQPRVRLPGGGTPDVPPAPAAHAIRSVERP